ncbi:hypothetical protein GC175_20215 [bacterium]|nr:hypothetical protein [bacterium]
MFAVSRKFSLTVLSALLLMVLAVTPSSAAGNGPDDATSPAQGSVTIDSGEWHWYAFRDEGDGEAIQIEMDVDGSATFEVWTAEQIRRWANGEEVDAVGSGSSNDYVNADLVWNGSFVQSGNYYVLVKQGSGSSNYQLRISGDDVSFPAPTAEMETVTETTTTGSTAPQAEVEQNNTLAGQTTEIDGQWRSINSQNPATYTFAYVGDNEQVTLKMEVSPTDTVSFAVWTPAQWAEHSRGEDVDPVGRGSAEKDSVLTWSGSFNQAGEYVVTVEATGAATGFYALTIE